MTKVYDKTMLEIPYWFTLFALKIHIINRIAGSCVTVRTRAPFSIPVTANIKQRFFIHSIHFCRPPVGYFIFIFISHEGTYGNGFIIIKWFRTNCSTFVEECTGGCSRFSILIGNRKYLFCVFKILSDSCLTFLPRAIKNDKFWKLNIRIDHSVYSSFLIRITWNMPESCRPISPPRDVLSSNNETFPICPAGRTQDCSSTVLKLFTKFYTGAFAHVSRLFDYCTIGKPASVALKVRKPVWRYCRFL